MNPTMSRVGAAAARLVDRVRGVAANAGGASQAGASQSGAAQSGAAPASGATAHRSVKFTGMATPPMITAGLPDPGFPFGEVVVAVAFGVAAGNAVSRRLDDSGRKEPPSKSTS